MTLAASSPSLNENEAKAMLIDRTGPAATDGFNGLRGPGVSRKGTFKTLEVASRTPTSRTTYEEAANG